MKTTEETDPLPETPRTVLAYGTPVRLSFIDMDGFCGRELHPHADDVGFLGIVVGNALSRCGEDYAEVGLVDNAPAGVRLGEFDFVCYTVEAPDGRRLELVDHEVEDMSVPAAPAA